MFPYVKVGIERILDAILAENERVEKERTFETLAAKKTGELRGT